MVRIKVVFKLNPQVGTISNDIFNNSSERKTKQSNKNIKKVAGTLHFA